MLRTRVPLLGGLAAATLATALATCGRDSAAPRQPAAFAITASLPPGLNLAALNLTIDHVRLIAVNSAGDTAFQQLYSFPANQSTLSLTADVPLAQSPETFQVTIQLLSGTVQVLFSGTQTISLASGSSNPTAQVPVTYSGPGQNVASLTLGPLDSLLTEGATLQMRVTAKDGNGATVPIFYASWSTSDMVAVPIDATGTLKAPLARRTITVKARAFPDTTITSSTTLQFVPLPSAVAFDSGCAQSGLPGVQLPQPIVARVLGNDALGVPGVTVQFAAPAGGSVTTASAVTDSGGRARTLVTLPSVAGPAQFQATVTGLTAAVCGPAVLSSPPTQLAFKTQPANAVAGATLGSIQVEVRDASGNLVGGATNAVTIAIGTNPGGGTLSGTKTVNAVAGIATFAGLSLDKVGTGYTLAATSSGLSSATSTGFNIAVAALNKIVFTTQPVNMIAGAPFTTVVVTAQDTFGNTVPSFTGNVTLAFGTHPGAATSLGGTTTVAAVAGVATFANLAPLTVTGLYTLVASASGVSPDHTTSFTVSAAAPAVLVFLQQPTGGFAGAPIAPAVLVGVEDTLGNIVTPSTAPVTMAFGANPGQGSLGGTLTMPASSGVATFSDLKIGVAASGYTLVATSPGLTSVTSVPFDEVVQPPGVVWKAPVSGNWSNPANWSPARVPGPSDTASIVLPGTYVVNLDVGAHVAFLVVGDTIGGIIMDVPVGQHLLIDSSAVILRAGSMGLAGSDTIGGAGNLTNQGVLTMVGSVIATPFFTNSAGLQVGGVSAITGSFSNSSGGALIIYASGGDAALTFASGFLNAGGIVLENTDGTTPRNVTLAVSNGTLTNVVGSILQTDAPTNAGNRTLAAQLDNQGALLVSHTLTIDLASATHGNSGTILLSGGGDLNVILSGTRPALSNESGGLIDVGSNKLVITNQSTGTFLNQAGGTIEGAGGTIDIGTSSFITNGTVTVGVASPATLTWTGQYTQGPSPSVLNVFLQDPTTPGVTFSQFQVSDTVTIQTGASLNATLVGPYVAGSYPIITVPAGKIILGDFTTKTLPINPINGGQCSGAALGTQYVITCPP